MRQQVHGSKYALFPEQFALNWRIYDQSKFQRFSTTTCVCVFVAKKRKKQRERGRGKKRDEIYIWWIDRAFIGDDWRQA